MKYVSYGSNMNVEQMKVRCPKSHIVGVGKLEKWKLVFNYHADIIKTENENDFVPVVLWELDDEDEERLDVYEGYPKYYYKTFVDVNINGNIITGMVYIMNPERKIINLPSAYYFDIIKEGYIENHINTKSLYNALAFTHNEVVKRESIITRRNTKKESRIEKRESKEIERERREVWKGVYKRY